LIQSLAQLLTPVMGNFARIARIGEQRRQPRTQPEAIIHLAEQQRAAITGDVGRVKCHRQR
jgi:hypothetical protein